MDDRSLRIEARGPAAWVWLARPAAHNAFDDALVRALTATIGRLDVDPQVRVIVLAGEGASFSAGADLPGMARLAAASPQDNLADARRLAGLFRAIAHSPKPTIARVHGAAVGGGVGLAAACDICVASTSAWFALTEVRLGLVPAAIGPHVVRALGERQARRYFQTGERIDAALAWRLGLAHEVVEPDQLDATVQRLVEALLAGGPLAQAAATALIRTVANQPLSDGLVEVTAACIADLRATPEAREGLQAFLDKRPPSWKPVP